MTAFGALAVSAGSPPLVAVVVAALGAFCGDADWYLVGGGWDWIGGRGCGGRE